MKRRAQWPISFSPRDEAGVRREDAMADDDNNDLIPRRNFLLGAGTALAASVASPGSPAAAEPETAALASVPDTQALLTLTETEHAFIVAAVDVLIPADELSPSGSECGVATFIDRQLAGAYGAGARLYR